MATTQSFCMICGNKKTGIKVQDDYVLDAARSIKRAFKKGYKPNKLVVCKDCYRKYEKARNKFESRRIIYVGLALAFAAITLISNLSIGSVIASIGVVVAFYILALLSYVPALEERSLKHKQKQ